MNATATALARPTTTPDTTPPHRTRLEMKLARQRQAAAKLAGRTGNEKLETAARMLASLPANTAETAQSVSARTGQIIVTLHAALGHWASVPERFRPATTGGTEPGTS